MIQEISPKRFWNAYEKREPEKDSAIICVWNGNYCIIHEEQGDRFPRYEELLREADAGADLLGLQSLQYLFAILDGAQRTDYFLCVCKTKNEFSQLPAYCWESTRYINHKMSPRRYDESIQHRKVRWSAGGACGNDSTPPVCMVS